jgi:hypothetical protein
MKSVAIAFPILPGKTQDARRFAQEVQGPRRQEMEQSLRAHGATREEWYLQTTPQGGLVIVYVEADDPTRLFQQWAQSTAPFDTWFKQQAGEISGMDFNQPLSDLPEQVFAWSGR